MKEKDLSQTVLLSQPQHPRFKTQLNTNRLSKEGIFSSSLIKLRRDCNTFNFGNDITFSDKYDVTDYIWSKIYDTGLVNNGLTCYMNSCLQILYHTDIFRCSILREVVEPKKRVIEGRDHFNSKKNLSGQLRELFVEMMLTDKPSIKSHIKFLENDNMGWDDQSQHDAHECMTRLISQSSIEDKNHEKIFTGTTETLISCQKCNTITRKEETFISLDIPIKNINHLNQGIENFLRSEKLEGENQFNCEICQCKQNAHRQTIFKELPDVLMIQLLRFDMNKTTFKRFKLSNDIFISSKLDMKQFATMQNEKSNYELYGMISHAGTASSGHYIAFIKNFFGTWFKYDDDHVSLLQYPSQIFSGEFQPYILFYRRIHSNMKNPKTSDIQLNNETIQKYCAENEKFHKSMLKHRIKRIPIFIQYNTKGEFFKVNPKLTWKQLKEKLLKRLEISYTSKKVTLFNVETYPFWKTTTHYDEFDDYQLKDIPFRSLLFTWSVKYTNPHCQINILQLKPKSFIEHWKYNENTTGFNLYHHLNEFISADIYCYKQSYSNKYELIHSDEELLSKKVQPGDSIYLSDVYCGDKFTDNLKFMIHIPKYEVSFSWATHTVEANYDETIKHLKQHISKELLSNFNEDQFYLSTGKIHSHIISNMELPLNYFFNYQNIYVFKGKQLQPNQVLIHFLCHHSGATKEKLPDIYMNKRYFNKDESIHLDGDHLHYAIDFKKTDFWFTSHTDIFNKEDTLQLVHDSIKKKFFRNGHFILRRSIPDHVFACGTILPNHMQIRQEFPFCNEIEIMIDLDPNVVNLSEEQEKNIIVRVRRYYPNQRRMNQEQEFSFASDCSVDQFFNILADIYKVDAQKISFAIVNAEQEPFLVLEETLQNMNWRTLQDTTLNNAISHYPLCIETGVLVILIKE